MRVKTTGNDHINHQVMLSPTDDFKNERNRRFGITQREFDSFNPNQKQYLNSVNTKPSKQHVVDTVLQNKPVAAITMVFNCAIYGHQSVDLLNRFHDKLCKYEYHRSYKNRNEFIVMFAFLENAVRDKKKIGSLRHVDCNHFHLILCDPDNRFSDYSKIESYVQQARMEANRDFKKAFTAEMQCESHIPQIARCKVQEYFNNGDNGLENYCAKNLESYSQGHDLNLDRIGYPSSKGVIFGDQTHN